MSGYEDPAEGMLVVTQINEHEILLEAVPAPAPSARALTISFVDPLFFWLCLASAIISVLALIGAVTVLGWLL